MITWSHDEPYSVQIFFFRFIINFIVILDLEKIQKLSKIIILSRILLVIHQFKSAATPNFGLKFSARLSVAWSPVNLMGLKM